MYRRIDCACGARDTNRPVLTIAKLRCVHIMDHHCTFLANCIGRGNRKLFLLSLYYGFLLSVLVVLTAPKALGTMASATTHSQEPPEALYVLYLIICFVVFLQSAMYSVATFSLAAFQTFLVQRDETTIEFRRLHEENESQPTLDPNDALLNPHGFKEVFGRCVLLWFLPIFPNESRPEPSYDELPT